MALYEVKTIHGDYWHDSAVVSEGEHICSCTSVDDARFVTVALNGREGLLAALEDCVAFIKGDISGNSQRLGILLEATRAIRLARSSQVERA